MANEPINKRDVGTAVTASAVVSFVISLLTLLLSPDNAPLPPQPEPVPIVDVEPTPKPLPDVAIRFTWVTDSSGLVIPDNDAKPLIESSLQTPGSYTVHTLRDRESTVGVSVGSGVSPTPNPQPQPQPGPQPKPSSVIWGIVIEESSTRTPKQTAVMASQEFREQFAGKLRIVDKDKGAVDYAKYIQQSVGRELPILWLVDDAGNVLSNDKLPESVVEAVAAVKKWRKS